MDHNGPTEGRIDSLDLFEELEHADGREWNSKVRPAGEMELGDQSGSFGVVIGLLDTKQRIITFNNLTTKKKQTKEINVHDSASFFHMNREPEKPLLKLTYCTQNLRMV